MLRDVFNEYAPKGMEILKQAIAKVTVTGRTLNSLRFVIDIPNKKLTYFGRGFMEALEHGRGPRKESSYGNFDSNLEGWLRAKGFPSKRTKSGKTYYQIGDQWFSAKSLAWRINKQGDRLFRSGQTKEVYSNEMDGFKNDLIEAVKKDQVNEMFNKIKETIK